MKILIYNSKNHVGGGETYIQNVYSNLKKLNHEVLLQSNNIDHFTKQALWNKNFDLVICNVYFPKDIKIFFLCNLKGIPILNIVHGIWLLESKSMNSQQKKLKSFIYYLSQYFMCLMSNRVVAVCNYQKKLMIKYFPMISKKIEIIPGAADNLIFYPIANGDRQKLKKDLFLPQNDNILLLATRLEKRKGIELAIQSLPIILKEKPNTLLVILTSSGAFNQEGYLMEIFEQIKKLKIGKHVHFISGVNKENVSKYYQIADISLMPSKYLENFSLVVIESISCACPVISFNTGGTPELLGQIDKRLIAKTTSGNSLAKKVLWYLNLTEKQKNEIRTKSIKIAKLYSWRRSSKQLVQIQNEKYN